MDFKTTLSLTKAQALLSNPSVSGKPYDKLVVGAIIFHPSSTTPKIFLVKRAAHETAFPNIFEIPGGKIDDTDIDILHGLGREVREETNMSFDTVSGCTEPLTYAIEKTVREGDKDVTSRTMSTQLNYVCEVADSDFRVDPREHSEGVWASRDEAAGLVMTDEMRGVVENAFKWKDGNMDSVL